MRDDEFEWDDDKSRQNLAKHKIAFETARLVFQDARLLDEPDESMAYGEERYKAVGIVEGRVLAVVYVIRGERTRIVSARKATTTEQASYVRQNPPE